MYLGVFQETKVTKGIYARALSRYQVVTSEAPIMHSICVAVFYRKVDHFTLEALHLHGAKVVIFHLA